MAKKKNNKFVSFIITAFVTIFTICLMVGSIFLIWVFSGSDYAFINSVKDISLKLNSTIYCLDNQTGEYVEYDHIVSEENRVWIDIENIPPDMQNAIVAIEDERFYAHGGVDIKRTFGAVINELKGGSTYGGSTLTQQLIKNITGDKERSKARKVREMLRAIALERQLEKSEILELYLNTIFLGQNSYGIETASNTYFGKSAKDLTLAEAACIAGITQYPTMYDPILNPENNEEKRQLVLKKMLELEYIDEKAYDEAVNTKLVFQDSQDAVEERVTNTYFTDFIIEQAITDLMEKNNCSRAIASNLLNNGGFKIYATIDTDIQDAMDKVYEDENSGFFVKNSSGETVQSAMVICDPYTGQIKGLVGGVGVKEGQRVLNRATQSERQPGSSIKPLSVYGPAIDTGKFTPASTINDRPIKIGSWAPKNDSGTFTGSMSLRNAIKRSQNIPAINIVSTLTPEVSYEYLEEKMHFTTLEEGDKNLSAMALGGMTHGVTVLEMTAAYSSFVNGGLYYKPTGYTKITNANDEVIIDYTKPVSNRVFSEDASYIMCDLMRGVVTGGTGVGAKIDGIDTAGKTGTSDKSHNRWFAGITPYYAGVTWYGYDQPQPIYASGNPALKIWKEIMDDVHEDLDDKEFEMPSTVKKVRVCTNSGKLATSRCYGITELVTKETASSSYCTGHKSTSHDYELPYSTNEDDKDEEEEDEGEEGTSEGEDGTESVPPGTIVETLPDEKPPASTDGQTTPSTTTPPAEPAPPSAAPGPSSAPVIDLSGA